VIDVGQGVCQNTVFMIMALLSGWEVAAGEGWRVGCGVYGLSMGGERRAETKGAGGDGRIGGGPTEPCGMSCSYKQLLPPPLQLPRLLLLLLLLPAATAAAAAVAAAAVASAAIADAAAVAPVTAASPEGRRWWTLHKWRQQQQLQAQQSAVEQQQCMHAF
jgi:hypothetical protein